MKTQTSGLFQPGYSRHPEKMISRSCGNLTHSHRLSTRPPCQRQQQPNPQKDAAGTVYVGPMAVQPPPSLAGQCGHHAPTGQHFRPGNTHRVHRSSRYPEALRLSSCANTCNSDRPPGIQT
ncbi:hypothetical protein U0070_001925 [Myodes glareolus]|uniref:Uncharacterized protein n=1 Tax=Myodes glareolus TaxID=447135 RepID=A0AAW0HJJ6_MYOGA